MLKKLFDFGTVFDWISPLAAEIQDRANGPSHTFLIPENCGWSGRAIAHLLKRHGIKNWGHMIVNQLIMITVRQAQAQWALYLLEREGIPTYSGPVGEYRPDPHHPRQRERRDPLDDALAWYEKITQRP